jgi:hypothetical protein
MRTALAALACLTLLVGEPARADNATDERTVETIIREQIAAFGNDDGERAFSYAAPDIRKRFGDPVSFMAMVRKSYAAVYRPKSLNFLQPSWPAGPEEGVILQAVELTDASGGFWVATYQVERQDNGEWRIVGCALRRLVGMAT